MQQVMVYVVGFNLYYRLRARVGGAISGSTLRQSVAEWGYD